MRRTFPKHHGMGEGLRLARLLLRPEDTRDGAWRGAQSIPAWAGRLKALLWACLAVLAGLGLARLGA